MITQHDLEQIVGVSICGAVIAVLADEDREFIDVGADPRLVAIVSPVVEAAKKAMGELQEYAGELQARLVGG